MLKDYQRQELKAQAEQAKQYLKSDCPLLEDEVVMAAWEYIQELESDRRRLEWLALNNARACLQDGWYNIHDSGGACIVYMFDDWRDAIDEAIKIY